MLAREVVCELFLISPEILYLSFMSRETPAISIPSSDAAALAVVMRQIRSQPNLKEEFVRFKTTGAGRYDVENSAKKLIG